MISWPDEVISAIARRRAVLFLGAGVSRNSQNAAGDKPPLWREFLEKGIERCTGPTGEMKKLLRDGDFLSCCQILKRKMGHDWVPFLEESFLSPQFLKADLHEELLRLDASIIVTPNFDKVFDNYATSQTSNLLKIKKYYDDDIPRVLRGGENQRLIIKIHGCIDTPDKLIFTREDYASIRSKYANFYRAMDALILTHTFIFIGCGMNDPDLSLLLEQYSGSFSAAPPHYVTWPGKNSTDYLRLLESNYNLRVLNYSSNDDHKELLESIRDLNESVQKKKDLLAERQLW